MKRRRGRRFTLMSCAVVYLLVMTFGGCGDRLILHRSTGSIDAKGATRIEIARAGGGIIEAWDFRSRGAPSQDAQVIVLEFTGNATRAEQVAIYVAGRWGDHPVESWTVNYPGYGGSTGPAQLRAIPPAALEASRT